MYNPDNNTDLTATRSAISMVVEIRLRNAPQKFRLESHRGMLVESTPPGQP